MCSFIACLCEGMSPGRKKKGGGEEIERDSWQILSENGEWQQGNGTHNF